MATKKKRTAQTLTKQGAIAKIRTRKPNRKTINLINLISTRKTKNIMTHPIFNASFCKLGHKVVSTLIDESSTRNCQKASVAEALNKELGLSPESFEAVTEQVVEAAIRSGAFDTATRAFGDFRGRYGGIREAALSEPVPAPKVTRRKKVEAPAEDPELVQAAE